MKNHTRYFLLFISVLTAGFLSGCTQVRKDNLSLWYDEAPAKKALVSYIQNVTDKKSKDFIPVENRIAVFDLDGTLVLETDPTYFDWALFEHRVLDDKSYKANKKQIAAARTGREKRIYPELSSELENMMAEAYQGLTLEEFYQFVRNFMQQDQPGFTNMKRGDIFYKPMVEVVKYLIKNKFTVYICSGTDRFILRPLVAENLPNIPPTQIIGSDSVIIANAQGNVDSLDYTFKKGDEIILGGKNIIKNLQMNKVSAIVKEIGMQPVLAFGNSSGDTSMLNYTINGNKYKALGFMLLCDDLEREYGNLEKAKKMQEDSAKYGWIPVSMHNDWKTIYGDNIKRRSK